MLSLDTLSNVYPQGESAQVVPLRPRVSAKPSLAIPLWFLVVIAVLATLWFEMHVN